MFIVHVDEPMIRILEENLGICKENKTQNWFTWWYMYTILACRISFNCFSFSKTQLNLRKCLGIQTYLLILPWTAHIQCWAQRAQVSATMAFFLDAVLHKTNLIWWVNWTCERRTSIRILKKQVMVIQWDAHEIMKVWKSTVIIFDQFCSREEDQAICPTIDK